MFQVKIYLKAGIEFKPVIQVIQTFRFPPSAASTEDVTFFLWNKHLNGICMSLAAQTPGRDHRSARSCAHP